MSEIDPNDLNQDGTVTQDEIDAISSGDKPQSFLGQLASIAPFLGVGPLQGLALPMLASKSMDSRDWEQRKQALQDQYPQAQQATTVAQQVVDQVSSNAAPAATPDKSGYLGVDSMLEANAAGTETLPDGTVRYFVNTKDGAREVRYKDADPYAELSSLGPKELLQWRKTMWLGGLYEPDSFVGPLNLEDVKVMQQAMTEANLSGVTWQDAIASRVEMGARYGRPITEAEIAQLDDDVPAMIQEYAQKNGVTVSNDFIARQQRRVLNGKDTPDGVLARLRDTYVKPMYPQFANELDNGLTLEDIASPYLDTASKMLEIPPQQISLNEPLIKKALQARDDQGTPVRKPLWAFEDELTKDPRWKYTDNAYAAMDGAVSGMLSEMGL